MLGLKLIHVSKSGHGWPGNISSQDIGSHVIDLFILIYIPPSATEGLISWEWSLGANICECFHIISNGCLSAIAWLFYHDFDVTPFWCTILWMMWLYDVIISQTIIDIIHITWLLHRNADPLMRSTNTLTSSLPLKVCKIVTMTVVNVFGDGKRYILHLLMIPIR